MENKASLTPSDVADEWIIKDTNGNISNGDLIIQNTFSLDNITEFLKNPENLESFATEYDYVYVAPFKGMDAKIAVTKLGKIDILEECRFYLEGKTTQIPVDKLPVSSGYVKEWCKRALE